MTPGYVSRAETRQSPGPADSAGRTVHRGVPRHLDLDLDLDLDGLQLILPAGRTTTSYTA